MVCVQGDEPMLVPDMIDAVVAPLKKAPSIPCTVLAMHITEEAIWRNPDTVNLIHNDAGGVLYTSRAGSPLQGPVHAGIGCAPHLREIRVPLALSQGIHAASGNPAGKTRSLR